MRLALLTGRGVWSVSRICRGRFVRQAYLYIAARSEQAGYPDLSCIYQTGEGTALPSSGCDGRPAGQVRRVFP